MDKKNIKKEELNKSDRNWHLYDASDKILGRLAVQIANVLTGKNKPSFESHRDHGDFVVVTNADKIKVTGSKYESKKYFHYSGYPGGMKVKTYRQRFEKDPVWVLRRAVFGMVPSNRLRNERMKRLKVYVGAKHPHEAQLGVDKK